MSKPRKTKFKINKINLDSDSTGVVITSQDIVSMQIVRLNKAIHSKAADLKKEIIDLEKELGEKEEKLSIALERKGKKISDQLNPLGKQLSKLVKEARIELEAEPRYSIDKGEIWFAIQVKSTDKILEKESYYDPSTHTIGPTSSVKMTKGMLALAKGHRELDGKLMMAKRQLHSLVYGDHHAQDEIRSRIAEGALMVSGSGKEISSNLEKMNKEVLNDLMFIEND